MRLSNVLASPGCLASLPRLRSRFGVGINANDILVRDCDLTGNLVGALTVDAGAGVEVTDCAAYNDRATILPSPTLGVTFTNNTLGYYGPIAFYVWGGAPLVTI